MHDRDISKLRFVIYARKSTEDEDRQVQSIGDQIDIMRSIASHRGITIANDAILSESRSAKIPGRRQEFDRLVEMIQSGKVDGILCWKLNRIARNPLESGLIQQLLIEGRLKMFATAERDYFPEDNVLMFTVEAGMATQFSRDLQRDIKRGMSSKVAKGWLPHLAPMGYLNTTDPLRGNIIVPDDERWQSYKQLWTWAMDPSLTISEIARKADKELGLKSIQRRKRGGTPLSVSGVYAMFRNPFYYGMLNFNKELHPGQHLPMITKVEFDKVQARLSKISHQRPMIERGFDYFSVYRGMIQCGECGCSITYTRKIRKYKNGNEQAFEYIYCTNKRQNFDCPNKVKLKPQQLSDMVKNELSRYTIRDEFYQFAIKHLNQWNDEQEKQRETVRTAQQKALNDTEGEMYGLQRMLYTGRCDEVFYDGERKKIEQRLKMLRQQSENTNDTERHVHEEAREYFDLAKYAKSDFDSNDPIKQREVLSKLGERMIFANGSIRIQPIKYLEPVQTMKQTMVTAPIDVVTYSDKRKNVAINDVRSVWYTREDSNFHIPKDTST